MPLPGLLLSIPPALSEQLRLQTEALRSRIVRSNYNTQFAQTAPELADFRHATAGLVDEMDDDNLSESFQRTVGFTTCDSYKPLVEKVFKNPCKAGAIVSLLAPGLPDYLVKSSSTSGGIAKAFLKYNYLPKIRSEDVQSSVISGPLRKRTSVQVWYLGCERMYIKDEENGTSSTIYVSAGSALFKRLESYLDPDKDEERLGTFLLDHAAPYAALFIRKWRSFLLIHAVFALCSRSIENMSMAFISTFVDMIRYIDTEFDMVLDCIENGTIPDLDGIAEFRHHLEANIAADPERAAEVRHIGRPSSRPGWCGQVWPHLRFVTAIASGSFASSVPLARWFLGCNADIHTSGYPTTECWIGSPYKQRELNCFKLSSYDIIELLDVSKDVSISALAQPWEVELGKQYEPVLTTRDGLWRYRLEDVVEISGFDPTDGVPIIQFVERRNVVMRFPNTMVSEKELREAMSSVVLHMPVKVVNWTATIDDRTLPLTIGFFVELAGDQVSELRLAPARLLDELSCLNKDIGSDVTRELFRKPTIRVLQSGTFRDFLQLKLDEGSRNVGQVKVPVVLPKADYVRWFANRVVREF